MFLQNISFVHKIENSKKYLHKNFSIFKKGIFKE